jgi:hypothetical protein
MAALEARHSRYRQRPEAPIDRSGMCADETQPALKQAYAP